MIKETKIKKIWHFVQKCNLAFVITIVILWIGALVFNNYSNYQVLKRNDLSQGVNSLEDDLRLLNAQVSELQATQRIEQESVRLELVKVDAKNIYYLDIDNTPVALK